MAAPRVGGRKNKKAYFFRFFFFRKCETVSTKLSLAAIRCRKWKLSFGAGFYLNSRGPFVKITFSSSYRLHISLIYDWRTLSGKKGKHINRDYLQNECSKPGAEVRDASGSLGGRRRGEGDRLAEMCRDITSALIMRK